MSDVVCILVSANTEGLSKLLKKLDVPAENFVNHAHEFGGDLFKDNNDKARVIWRQCLGKYNYYLEIYRTNYTELAFHEILVELSKQKMSFLHDLDVGFPIDHDNPLNYLEVSEGDVRLVRVTSVDDYQKLFDEHGNYVTEMMIMDVAPLE